MNTATTRRSFLGTAATGLGLLPLATLADTSATASGENRQLKVVCVGAHPDDPESICGGTLLKLNAAGHAVTVFYLTRGEAGIEGKSHAEAAALRTKEAEEACRILQAKPVFLGQIDGDTFFNNQEQEKFEALLTAEKPDLVFTHWPLDSHKDHQVASMLTVRAWMRAERKFEVYFCEAEIGQQSVSFHPTDYVDISAVQEAKKRAVFCHASQQPAEIYESGGHALMERFRGVENGVKAAEAFVRLVGRKSAGLI